MFNPRDYPDLLVGLESPDDAAVYRLDDQRALVATTDFFTPIVDDPYDYGAIAAANSLSDVYSMGAKPILALSIVAFPLSLPAEVLTEVMRGLGETVRRAGAVIAGGHSIKDKEPKVGLCVLGLADPRRLLTKGGGRVGDQLALTKPLGNGIIATAAKGDRADPNHLAAAIGWMKRLNRTAADVAVSLELKGGTDITGFGLLGHGWEMAAGAGVGFRLFLTDIPFLDGARAYAEQRLFPGGGTANLKAYQPHVRFGGDLTDAERMLLADPQTSGGLLLAVPPAQRADFEARMAAEGEPCWFIGEVVEGNEIVIERKRS